MSNQRAQLAPLQGASTIALETNSSHFPEITSSNRGNLVPIPQLPGISQLRDDILSISGDVKDAAYRNSVGLPRRRRKRKSVVDAPEGLSMEPLNQTGLLPDLPKSGAQEEPNRTLVCPRCREANFTSVRELSRHAAQCDQQQDNRRVSVLHMSQLDSQQATTRTSTNISLEQQRKYQALEKEMKELLELQKKAAERRKLILAQEEVNKQSTDQEKESLDLHALPNLGVVQDEQISLPITASPSSPVAAAKKLRPVSVANVVESKESDSDLWTHSEHDGFTLAHFAVYENNVDQLSQILTNGGDTSLADPEGRTPVHYAAMYGSAACAQYLLREMNPSIVQRCLNLGDVDGKTPLHWACSSGYFNIAALFLDCDPRCLHVADFAGDTCLHTASRSGHVDLVAFLLQSQAGVDGPPNLLDETPLHLAASAAVAECLVQAGADLNALDSGGRSVLFHLSSRGIVDAVVLLMQIDLDGESTSFVDNWGDSPLHAAACNGHIDCVRALLESAVEPGTRNLAGFTASMLAVQHGHVHCAELIAEYGVPVPTSDQVAEALQEALQAAQEAEERRSRASLGGAQLKPLAQSHGNTLVPDNVDDSTWYECPVEGSENVYYWQKATGVSTWVRPVGAEVLPLVAEENEKELTG